jgi:hypothetical protein
VAHCSSLGVATGPVKFVVEALRRLDWTWKTGGRLDRLHIRVHLAIRLLGSRPFAWQLCTRRGMARGGGAEGGRAVSSNGLLQKATYN